MTTIAYHNYCNIPFIGGSYNSYKIQPKCAGFTMYGKTMNHSYPNSSRPINQGILYGLHPNPPQFQSGDASSSFARERQQYKTSTEKSKNVFIKKTWTPLPYSLYLKQQKVKNVGQSSISNSGPLSYKAYDRNYTKSVLQRIRNASCVAPAKKGAIH
jgi:hypothetical protein